MENENKLKWNSSSYFRKMKIEESTHFNHPNVITNMMLNYNENVTYLYVCNLASFLKK
jgi:hypothetical protein